MFPSWGNYGAPPPQSFGGPGPRKPPIGTGQAPGGFGGYEASSSGSLFSSLQEQHRQQMQQLQMLHQKQLQSVLHHGNSGTGFGGGLSGGFNAAPPWHPEGPGKVEGAEGSQQYLMQDKTPAQTPRGPLPTNQGQQQQPPPQPAESKPVPPPPESQPPKSQENVGAPVASNTNPSSTNDSKSVPLQDQQNVWYKQHLQNLQKLRQEKAQQNQMAGNAFLTPQPPSQALPPPPPSEPPKGTPPPPPPRDEPPVPPPPPVEVKPDAPKDPEEAARLQQLQAAAAQWQQVQQQRVSLQYQALMQQHEKLQQILEQYQRLIQQPPNLQTMSAELQLRHYEMQHQQFIPLFQNWNSSFALWHEQFQSYPHKDQLQDYELQWKQWQEQMNATNAHLQERVATITAMVPFASGQYGAMMGQLGQYPGQDMPLQQQVVNPGVQPTVVGAIATAPGPAGATAASATGATAPGQQPPTFVAHSESSDGPLVQGSPPVGVGVIPPGPLTMQTSSFNNIREPRPSRFDQPPQGFDGPPTFNQSQQRFDGPPRFNPPRQRFEGPTFDQPRQHFDGPTRFDQPRQRFDGPSRFEQPRHRFDGPPRFDQQRPRFDGPQRFDQPRQRFDGPQRFDQPLQRFDGPQRFDQPRQRFDGPPRFDQPRPRFDNPPRHDQPNFGQQSRLDSSRPPCPPPHFESPSVPQLKQQQGPEPKLETNIQNPASSDSTTLPKAPAQPLSNKNESIPNKSTADDLTDDNLLGSDGFFIQNDPIPQTLKNKKESEEAKNKSVTDDSNKDKPSTSTKDSASVSKPPPPPQNSQKDDGPMTDNKKSIKITAEIQSELQSSDQLAPKPEPPNLPPGRGRGQPPLRGLGRGPLGPGQFREHNTAQTEEGVDEMPYDYIPPEEDTGIPEEQQDYWQDPSYQGFGEDESEMRPEDTWVPEEHYFEEEEYYEEPVGPYMGRGRPPMRGGPPMGRGRPPMGRGFPPMGRGVPPMGRGFPPMGRGGPPMGRGGPPMGRGGPPMGRGGPPLGRGGPPMGRGGPPMGRGGPPMGRGGPPMVRGGPPMVRGGPPMVRGGPPFSRGGPPVGRGGAHMGIGGPAVARGDLDDMHWAEAESAECSEEGEPYWEEWRPQMRGMRPPFPPGRGRPPRGHPGFMARGRGGPLHPIHGEMAHEPVGHEMELDDANVDQSMHPMYHEHDPYGQPGHPDVGRGRRRIPPPPHEIRDHLEQPLYEGAEEDSEWYPPRGPPMTPHEIIDRGGMRRRPMGRGIARGMWRPGPHHEGYEEYKEDQALDYDRGEGEYRRPPAPEFPPEDYRHEAKFREGEWDRDRPLPEREYPPRMPPPPHLREERWDPETERRRSYPYDENNRARGELRILDYRDEPSYRLDEPPHLRASDWDRSSRRSPLPVRTYPDYGDLRPQYEERKEEPPPAGSATDLPGSSVEAATQGTSGANVLALSQRQHEIILKAAQELKQIRELQEGKTPSTEKPQPASSDLLPDLPAGLLGLEIPADVRNVLKGMSAAVQSAGPESASWESKPPAAAVDYQSSLSASAKPPVIPKTVDYGHGHELGATVERIAYGERIVLRPDPIPSDRLYDKEPLGLRDSYSRDPYYDRRPDPYLDRREYSRERELYRDAPPEYERDRYERERYHSRERDERSPLPPRGAYRERDKERSGSRDPDDYYGRPGYDRPLYERSGPDRIGPERYSSPYLERRGGYPEDRGPHPAASLPPPPTPPPPRVEKKPEIKNIDDILKAPGRLSRPERIVIIMRGLPGSGKSHVAKLIRDKEVECGGAPPRVLVLDDYFMTEVEKVEKDPDTGKRVKNKVLEYEYEPEMEDTYRSSMLKTFKKTLDDGFFPFIILDTINDRVKHFEQFWSAAKTKGFEVYVAEITADTQTCAKRNVHGRKLKDITKMSNNWESSPRHMVRLDVRSLLQDAAIEEVEMEDFNPEDVPQETKREEEEESDLGYLPKSKWEMDTSEAKLDKLDGLVSGGKRKRDSEHLSGIEDYLQLPDDYATRTSAPGKKRVRWADLEEQKDADRKRAIGFVVGQTDWEKITDESGQFAQRALNRTKYF